MPLNTKISTEIHSVSPIIGEEQGSELLAKAARKFANMCYGEYDKMQQDNEGMKDEDERC